VKDKICTSVTKKRYFSNFADQMQLLKTIFFIYLLVFIALG